MCLLVLAFHVHPDYPLVVAANRDEMLDRPASPMELLRAAPRTLGGRDRRAGGTWLAVNEDGVVAGLTNRPSVGGEPSAERRSRGELPLALTAFRSAEDAVGHFQRAFRAEDFNGAWLLVADRSTAWVLDMTTTGAPGATRLEPGVHVLENRAFDRPSPKVEHVRSRLRELAAVPGAELVRALGAVLADHTVPEGARAADESSVRPAELSAACIHGPGYGTRWAGVVLVASAGPPDVSYADGSPCTTPFRAAAWSA